MDCQDASDELGCGKLSHEPCQSRGGGNLKKEDLFLGRDLRFLLVFLLVSSFYFIFLGRKRVLQFFLNFSFTKSHLSIFSVVDLCFFKVLSDLIRILCPLVR